MRKRAALLLALTATLGVAACGSDESREDADDVGNGQIEKDAPSVTAFNNKYPNVEHKCLREQANGPGVGLRVIVNTDKRMIVIPDPHCDGYMPEQANTAAVGGNQP